MLVNVEWLYSPLKLHSHSLPHNTPRDLMRYCLWLLECSHKTGSQCSVMFFGLALPFPSVLEVFNSNDGLRRLYNKIRFEV